MFLRQCFGCRKSKSLFLHQTSIGNNDEIEKISTIECLPNEVLFLIFDYMNCHEIISAFINLNIRLQSLLSSYSSHHLSNSSQLTKKIFELMQQLSLCVENTTESLTLYYTLDSIIDVDQFFSIYPIDLFYAKLKVLSFHLDQNLPTSLIHLLPNFQQLTHLSILSIKKHDRFTEFAEESICHTIFFEIKTLNYFKSNIRLAFSIIDSEQISTIEYLELYRVTFNQLYWLCLRMPNLKSITIEDPLFSFEQEQHQLQQTFEQINCLKLNFLSRIDNVQRIFEHLKHFTHLKHFELQGQCFQHSRPIDGYQLASLIQQHIPQIKIFKFFFIIYQIWLVDMDDFIQSFQTDFWLIEKQWFVTCNYQDETKLLSYYTESSIRRDLKYTSPWIQMSTAIQRTNSTVDKLTLSIDNSLFLRSLDHFNNIQSLSLFMISPDVTYTQLSRCINFSSMKHFKWKSEANSKLFFDILKYCSANLNLHISSLHLLDIINRSKRKQIEYLKKIGSLHITDHQRNRYDKKAIYPWCSYFPNVKQLFLSQGFTQAEISYIINSFESLTFLFVICGRLILSDESTFIDSLQIHKDSVFYRWYIDELYLWFE